MIMLYLKTLIVAAILLCFILFGYYFGFSYFARKRLNEINTQLSKGTFSYIQNVLKKLPETQWAPTLKKIQPTNAAPAKITPILSLKISRHDKTRLLNGDIIFLEGRDHLFLDYGIDNSLAIQRIGGSHYALQMLLGEPINQIIHSTVRWIVKIILYQLDNTPKEKQPTLLENLHNQFGMPLTLMNINNKIISTKMKADLKTYKMAYFKTKNNAPISTLYFPTSIPNKILVLGPIHYSALSQRYATVQHYYFIIFATTTILIVIFLTWLFSRNIKNIYYLTQKYSVGDFKYHTKINKFSILYGAYQNIIAMGTSLHRLIQAQNNMTRFVAHEVRTPLSTIQLALDSLKKENHLSHQSQKNLVSIQDDIEEINKLISYFLLYYQGSVHELKLETTALNISDWLASIVERYALSKINVTFIQLNKEAIHSNIDASLLKHAIDNLITNALKFAKANSIVSLDADNHHIKINVEDDGPGIPESETKTIFEPFSTSHEDHTFGKHIGLGLTIAKSIIELHQGSIMASNASALGGARFSILLPIK